LYDYSWFVGFAVAFAAYYGMMKARLGNGASVVAD